MRHRWGGFLRAAHRALAGIALLLPLAPGGAAFAQPAELLAQAIPPAPPFGDESLLMAAGELHRARVVKGAPYCADALTEHVQQLPDGNRIVRSNGGRLCRDADGRTRYDSERATAQGAVRRVFIFDPVAQEAWLLNPDKKLAMKMPRPGSPQAQLAGPMPTPPADGNSEGWNGYAERMRKWAQALRAKLRGPAAPQAAASAPAADAAVETVVVQGAGGREVRVEAMRISGADAPFTLPFAGAGLPRGPGEVVSLGSKTLEGVRVDGTRTTWTIEAGKIGNEKPIIVTHEVWRSPELMVTVASHHSDPRRGDSDFRLSNLSRAAPSPELFRVPADYSVRELPRLPPHPPAAPPLAAPGKG